MTKSEIANQPAQSATFFQECVKINASRFVTSGGMWISERDIPHCVSLAIALAEETCKQLAERSNQ